MTQNKHQLKGSLRNVYRGMKDRCTNPNNKNYNLYKEKLLTSGIEHAIFKAGEYFKLRVPLKGEAKTGLNWKEIK